MDVFQSIRCAQGGGASTSEHLYIDKEAFYTLEGTWYQQQTSHDLYGTIVYAR